MSYERSTMTGLKGQPFFSSWSGGKDACLALYRAVQAGGKPAALLNMCIESGERSRSHGLATSVLNAQAAAMDLSIDFQAASWDDYEKKFLEALASLRSRGIDNGVFGDIDLDPHREWVERVCAEGGITPHEPLWLEPRRKLVDEFLAAGFKARIVSLKEELLPREMLGEEFTPELVEKIEAAGCDACGENGEFHTVVTGGPLFARELELVPGEVVSVAGYACVDFSVT